MLNRWSNIKHVKSILTRARPNEDNIGISSNAGLLNQLNNFNKKMITRLIPQNVISAKTQLISQQTRCTNDESMLACFSEDHIMTRLTLTVSDTE